MEFRSAEQAVRFAYNISERAEFSKSDPLRVRGTSRDDLSPMDLHAQSAMIQSQINRLHPVERSSILALYGKGKDRTDAIRYLGEYLYPFVSGTLPSRSELEILICHWVTRRPAIRAIAEDRGVSYRKVCQWRSAVLRSWLPVQARAIDRLHDTLVSGGVQI
ncbi:hypothetical protein UFOVP1298_20 [uncultured Caudovirales phage]|jgi:hypothetical protein|uniref:Uncharacterized protein n=1 Tax=uncultured Caudovirales phage TaxID=2100421 RepID=A0A6J5RSV7_9CAUD|nr:hypothetical protein UFOVP1298_20 [uncultured Caudovirales phage]